MLLAILLLLTAVGLLAAALVTGKIVLAWGSVAVSAVVAVLLLALGRRSRRRRREAERAARESSLEDVAKVDPLIGDAVPAGPAHSPNPAPAGQADPVTNGQPATRLTGRGEHDADDDADPDEEDTAPADLLVVRELQDEVLVVDEHPRYHLADCPWPDSARAERLPVREARELGFTPCAECRPDTTLARRRAPSVP